MFLSKRYYVIWKWESFAIFWLRQSMFGNSCKQLLCCVDSLFWPPNSSTGAGVDVRCVSDTVNPISILWLESRIKMTTFLEVLGFWCSCSFIFWRRKEKRGERRGQGLRLLTFLEDKKEKRQEERVASL